MERNEHATVKQVLGQVAVGVVGAGASVDILSLADNVQASDNGTNNLSGNLAVNAVLNSTVNITALDLAAGFVGLGAAVVVVNDDSVTQATLGSVPSASAVSMTADSTRTDNSLTGQASAGAIGAGATFSEITIGGSTTATVEPGSEIGSQPDPVQSLTITVDAVVNSTMNTDAVAAGIGAASANFSFLVIDPTVSATIGENATINAVNAVTVKAETTNDGVSNTFGVDAGGLAVGVSWSKVTVSPTVTASIDSGDSITAGSIAITAVTYLPASGLDATASSIGSAGALIAVNSTNSATIDDDSVTAFIGDAAKIVVVGAVVITALNNTAQSASANSNSGGLIAAGVAASSADTSTTTKAYIGNFVSVMAGDVNIAATGLDNNFAYTNAGSGGVVGISSSTTETTNNRTTSAYVGNGGEIVLSDTNVGPVNGFIMAADHTAAFNSQISTFAGGLFAGVGGNLTNNVTSNDTANVGNNAMITAYNIAVTATNTADKPNLPGIRLAPSRRTFMAPPAGWSAAPARRTPQPSTSRPRSMSAPAHS